MPQLLFRHTVEYVSIFSRISLTCQLAKIFLITLLAAIMPTSQTAISSRRIAKKKKKRAKEKEQEFSSSQIKALCVDSPAALMCTSETIFHLAEADRAAATSNFALKIFNRLENTITVRELFSHKSQLQRVCLFGRVYACTLTSEPQMCF